MQEGHDTPTGDDGTTSLEDRVQDGMSTHDGGNDNRTGSAGQAQAQVHPKDKFVEEPAGRTGTIGEHTMSGINAASSYSGKLQSPVTLVVTKSNSDNDENGWHKDNNSDCEYQVDDKAATLLVTKSNSDNDENSDCEYQVDDDEATTATIAVQGHHTQEGQLNSTSEPYPCARLNSGERGGKTYQVKDCQHLGRTFIDALKQADNTKVTAYDSKGESGIKANFETVRCWAKSERSPELARRKRTSSINALSEAKTHGRGPRHFQDAAGFSAIRRGPVGHGRPALYMSAPYSSREKRRERVGAGSYILWHAQLFIYPPQRRLSVGREGGAGAPRLERQRVRRQL